MPRRRLIISPVDLSHRRDSPKEAVFCTSTLTAAPMDADVARVTISMLPNVALEIFDFYVNQAISIEAWHKLVPMCRKWLGCIINTNWKSTMMDG
jgi:hypothetical protein